MIAPDYMGGALAWPAPTGRMLQSRYIGQSPGDKPLLLLIVEGLHRF